MKYLEEILIEIADLNEAAANGDAEAKATLKKGMSALISEAFAILLNE